ncbi:MAG: ABC transporter substrate-binding protein [Sphingobacteriaceae bacterium]|nr:ABC transporter substrate-binding protein [Sphingobacteriaceae bacterium]
MNKISIGLLLPSSSIFPISKDFEKGLNAGLKQNDPDLEVEIIKAFIGQGSVSQTEDACNKFFTYDDADIVTGIISGKVADEIAEKFNKRKTPLLVNTLGEYIPNFSKLGDHVFINSLNLWQHAWSLGYYGVKHFGKKGMFIGSVYDAGYDFSKMFHLGMKAADEESEWSFSVPPMPAPGQLSNMDVIFPFLEQYQPDFVFAAFCGTETTMFINEFIKRGWQHRTKLLGLPYLLTPFSPLGDDISIYTTLLSEEHPELQPDRAFYHLGFQSGCMISQAALENAASLSDSLSIQSHLVNKRYPEHIVAEINKAGKLSFVQNDIKAHDTKISRQKIVEYEYMPHLSKINPPIDEIRAGWYNPYLSI